MSVCAAGARDRTELLHVAPNTTLVGARLLLYLGQVHASFLEYYGRTAAQTPLVAYGRGGFRDVS